VEEEEDAAAQAQAPETAIEVDAVREALHTEGEGDEDGRLDGAGWQGSDGFVKHLRL
jgi:hypothetical protein